ncbi:hypothetical protein QOZ80_5AG0384060 [Eleusine coracana subsp. coracana]|nr:hypothetical protein QOZ80_5AG0384060 [Eleusine coracana subsp. coracana]
MAMQYGTRSMVARMEVSREAALTDHLDDDGRPRRSGTVWTASAHIITAVIGSGVLSLAWAIAQLGWVAGPTAMLLFAFVTYYTATLLAECYRTGYPETGRRNYTYFDAIRSNFNTTKITFCGVIQYTNLIGAAIGYISMLAIRRAGCFHTEGHANGNPCKSSSKPYMILICVVQVLFSQIRDFDQIWWLYIVTVVLSFFTYSSIGLSLGIAQIVSNGGFKGSLTGIGIGAGITATQKIWRSLQAFGDIAFAYSSNIPIEIQDTIKAAPPSEANVMQKATGISVAIITTIYMLCACVGYAAFGDASPDNLLTGFGFYEPFWLLDIANIAIVVHLVGAYQVFCQPIFAFVERRANAAWPNSAFIAKELKVGPFALSLFRLTWRSAFVCLTTVVAMLLPFFGNVVGLLGAVSFWPLTVYFPVEMYIKQRRVPRFSTKWVCLQTLSVTCFIISIAAAAGSIADVIDALLQHAASSGAHGPPLRRAHGPPPLAYRSRRAVASRLGRPAEASRLAAESHGLVAGDGGRRPRGSRWRVMASRQGPRAGGGQRPRGWRTEASWQIPASKLEGGRAEASRQISAARLEDGKADLLTGGQATAVAVRLAQMHGDLGNPIASAREIWPRSSPLSLDPPI